MKRSRQIQLLKISLLVGSLLFTFLFVVAGSGNFTFGDPNYWMRLCKEYNSSYLTIGTVALGHLWMHVIGDSIFSTRLLSWFCVIIAIAIPYVCLLEKEARKNNLHWLGMAYFLSGYGVFQEFSPGALSILLVSVVAVLWVKYIEDRRFLIPIVVCTSLAVVMRFPNVVLLLVLSILMVVNGVMAKHDTKRTILDIFIFVGGSTLFLLCFYALLGCDVSYDGFVGGFGKRASGSHTVGIMFLELFKKGLDLLVYSAVILAFGFLSIKIDRLPIRRKWLYSVGLVVVLLFYLMYSFSLGWYNVRLHYFISSITIVLALVLCFYCVKEKNNHMALMFVSFLLLGMVVPLGSDTGWMKLFPMYLCFLPYLLVKGSDFGLVKKRMAPLFVVITIFVVVIYFVNPIGGIPMKKSRCFGPYPYNKTLVSKTVRKMFVQFQDDYLEYGQGNHSITTGIGCHTFNMVTSCPLYISDPNVFFQDIEVEEFADSLCHYMESKKTVLFLMLYHYHYRDDKYSVEIEQRIKEIGYESIDRKNFGYLIFLPKTTN